MRGSMSHAPFRYLRLMAGAALAMLVGGLATPVLLVTAGLLGLTLAGSTVGTIAIATSALWVAGCVVYTRPRPPMKELRIDPRRESLWIRRAAWVTQTSWLFASTLTVHVVALAGPTPYNVLAALGFFLVGFLGVAPLTIWMGEIAHWANHTLLAEWGRGVACGICVGTPTILVCVLAMPFLGPAGAILQFIAVLAGAALVLTLVAMTVTLFGNASMCVMALVHARHALESAREAADRAATRAHEDDRPIPEPVTALHIPESGGDDIYQLAP